MKPSTLIVGYGITDKNLHREIATLNPDICDIDSAKSSTSTTIAKKIFAKLTFINVKNLHVKNIICNFVT